MHDFLFLPRSHKEVEPKRLPGPRVSCAACCRGSLYEPYMSRIVHRNRSRAMVRLSVACPTPILCTLYNTLCSVFFHALCSILYTVRCTPRSPFPSDSHNYLLCPSLESRSTCAHSSSYASRRAGSCNSWELGSVVLGDTMRYRLTEKGATWTNTFPVKPPAIYQWLDSLHSLQESFGNYGVVTHISTQRLSRVYSHDSEITWKFISGIDRCE